MSPEQVLEKRHALFKHQFTNDCVVFPGATLKSSASAQAEPRTVIL